MNYGIGKIKLFGNYGIRHSEGTVLYTDKRIYKDTSNNFPNSSYNDNGNSIVDALSHTVSSGVNYNLDDNNSFELSFDYFLQNSFHKAKSEINSYDSQKNKKYIYVDNETNDEHEEEGEGAVTYEHIFNNNEDHSISFEGIYSSFNEKEDQHYNQVYKVPGNLFESTGNLVQKSGNQSEVKLDYILPVDEEIEIESGYSGEMAYQDIRYTLDNSANRFLFNQDVHAFYLTYSQTFESFEFKAGLRGEQTFTKSHLTNPLDSLIKNSYFKFFPTLHFGYEFDEENKFSLSYSKRVNRPEADELNPNPEFVDPKTAEAGNPNITPEQIHSIEFGYQSIKKNITFTNTLYYRYKYDAFTSIRRSIGDTLVLFTIENLKTQSSFGFETIFSGSINDYWDYDLTGDIFYTTIDASNLGYSSNKSTVSGNIKGYTLINIFENTALQANAFYYFPTLTPQGKRNSIYYLNFAIKQQLFNKNLSVTFSVSDVLHTYKISRNINSNDLSQSFSIKRKYPVLYLGVTWRFNNFEKEENPYSTEGLKK